MGIPEQVQLETVELVDDPELQLVVGKGRKKRSCCARLVRAVIRISLAVFVIHALAHAARRAGFIRPCSRGHTDPDYVTALLEDDDGLPGKCFGGHAQHENPDYDPDADEPGFRYFDKLNISLPTDAAALFAAARGPLAYGFISFEAADPGLDAIEVDVTLSYNYNNTVRACALSHKGKDAHGLGIFTHRHKGHHRRRPRQHLEQVKVAVVVKLPGSADAPLALRAFSTGMPMFRHDVHPLQGAVRFEHLKLRGANFPITVESVDAEKLTITTANAPIKGTFNASDTLVLATSNAPIEAAVHLLNGADTKRKASVLSMTTANADIRAHVALAVPEGADKSGSYYVLAASANAPVNVKVTEAQAGALVRLDAATRNAPASVELPASYEGKFTLSSSLFGPTVKDLEPEDPTGEGRERTLEYKSVVRTVVSGQAFWGDKSDDTPEGSVTVSTANAPAHISL